MKLNSKKRNNSSKVILSIFFVLIFYLFFVIFGDFIFDKALNFKKNLDIYILDKNKILSENLKLKEKIEEDKIKNIFSNYYYNETKKLKEKISAYNNDNRLIFNIIKKNSELLGNKIVLKNTNKKKVKRGDIVFLFDNFAIGRVSKIINNFLIVDIFSDFGVKEKYNLIFDGKIIFKADGVGDSNGIIKIELPRDLEIKNKTIITLQENPEIIVGIFLKDTFKKQDTVREVYFKLPYNLNNFSEVEI